MGRVEPELIVATVCAVMRVGRDDLLKKGYRGCGRGLLMELLYRFGGMKQPEIGAMLGIDYSAVSVGRKRFLMMMETDPETAALFTKAKTRISQG
jgi:putative transposase